MLNSFFKLLLTAWEELISVYYHVSVFCFNVNIFHTTTP